MKTTPLVVPPSFLHIHPQVVSRADGKLSILRVVPGHEVINTRAADRNLLNILGIIRREHGILFHCIPAATIIVEKVGNLCNTWEEDLAQWPKASTLRNPIVVMYVDS